MDVEVLSGLLQEVGDECHQFISAITVRMTSHFRESLVIRKSC